MNTTTLMHTNQLMAIIDQDRENQLNEMFSNNVKINDPTDQQLPNPPHSVQAEQLNGPPPPYSAATESVSDSSESHTRLCSLSNFFFPYHRARTMSNNNNHNNQRQSHPILNYCKIFNNLLSSLLNNHH